MHYLEHRVGFVIYAADGLCSSWAGHVSGFARRLLLIRLLCWVIRAIAWLGSGYKFRGFCVVHHPTLEEGGDATTIRTGQWGHICELYLHAGVLTGLRRMIYGLVYRNPIVEFTPTHPPS